MKKMLLLIMISCLLVSPAECNSETEWKEKRGHHFLVYYKDCDRVFLRRLLERSEYLYTKITDDLGYRRYDYWTWDNRAKIYIYNDQEDYVNHTGQPAWSAGSADSFNKIINTYYGASEQFFNTVLAHEMGHLMLREFIGLEASVPLWFEEGVATMQEKGRRRFAKKEVRAALSQGKFIPLAKLSDIDIRNESNESLVRLFYNESLMVVYFLIDDYGSYKFRKLCRVLRDAEAFGEAIKGIYHIDSLDELNEKFIKYMR